MLYVWQPLLFFLRKEYVLLAQHDLRNCCMYSQLRVVMLFARILSVWWKIAARFGLCVLGILVNQQNQRPAQKRPERRGRGGENGDGSRACVCLAVRRAGRASLDGSDGVDQGRGSSPDARRRGRMRVESCDNLVTIGSAKGRAWRFRGFLLVRCLVLHPLAASTTLQQRSARRPSTMRRPGMGAKRRGAGGGPRDPRGAPAPTDG